MSWLACFKRQPPPGFLQGPFASLILIPVVIHGINTLVEYGLHVYDERRKEKAKKEKENAVPGGRYVYV